MPFGAQLAGCIRPVVPCRLAASGGSLEGVRQDYLFPVVAFWGVVYHVKAILSS